MDLEIIADRRRRFAHVKPIVSINPKLGKIVIFQTTYDLAKKKVRLGDFEYVQCLLDKEDLSHFFIRPCKINDEGAKKVTLSGRTRIIVAKLLLERLGYAADETKQFPVSWNRDAKALEVDLKAPLKN